MLLNPSMGGGGSSESLGGSRNRKRPDEGAPLDKTVEGVDAGPQEPIGPSPRTWLIERVASVSDPDGYTIHPGAPSG